MKRLRNLLNTLQKKNQSSVWRATRSSPTKSLKTRSFVFPSATNSIGSPTKRVGEARMQFESFKLRGILSRGAHKAMPRAPHGETPRSVVRIHYPLPLLLIWIIRQIRLEDTIRIICLFLGCLKGGEHEWSIDEP